jgi:hypothetical protein
MSTTEPSGRVDVSALEEHLSEALECADRESTKYHLREAYQKVVILEEE